MEGGNSARDKRRGEMNTVENTVGATYRDGRIVLDRPMNWTEGTRVVVQLMPEYGLIEGVWPADGSPEGDAEIQRRMAEFEAMEPHLQKEADAFAAALEEVRRFSAQAPFKKMGSES